MNTPKTFSDPEKAFTVLRNLIDELKRKQAVLEKEIERLKPIADLEGLESRLESIFQMTAAMRIKDAVMSEVAYCDPNIAGRLWALRDAPESFWLEKQDWTINEWVAAIKGGLVDDLLESIGAADGRAA